MTKADLKKALATAVDYIPPHYRKDILDEVQYKRVMEYEGIRPQYKTDITLIRAALNSKEETT